jgi:hypothetical protein
MSYLDSQKADSSMLADDQVDLMREAYKCRRRGVHGPGA